MLEITVVLDAGVVHEYDVQHGETVRTFLDRVSVDTGLTRSLLSAVHEGEKLSNGDVMSDLPIAGGDEVQVKCDEKIFSLKRWGMSPTPWWLAETLSGPEPSRLQKLFHLILADKTLVESERAEDGASPLHVAVEKDLLEEVVLLLYMGADISATNEEGETPLHVAAKGNLTNVLRALLPSVMEKPGFIDTVDIEGRTALYHAASRGGDESCKVLKCNRADVHLSDYNAWSPCAVAEYNGHGDTADIIAGAEVVSREYRLEYCARLVDATWSVVEAKCRRGGGSHETEQRCYQREKCATDRQQENAVLCCA